MGHANVDTLNVSPRTTRCVTHRRFRSLGWIVNATDAWLLTMSQHWERCTIDWSAKGRTLTIVGRTRRWRDVRLSEAAHPLVFAHQHGWRCTCNLTRQSRFTRASLARYEVQRRHPRHSK